MEIKNGDVTEAKAKADKTQEPQSNNDEDSDSITTPSTTRTMDMEPHPPEANECKDNDNHDDKDSGLTDMSQTESKEDEKIVVDGNATAITPKGKDLPREGSTRNITKSPKSYCGSLSDIDFEDGDLDGTKTETDMDVENTGVKIVKRRIQKKTAAALSGRKPNPFKRPHLRELKRTRESFVQDEFCTDITTVATTGKCRECRYFQNQSARKQNSIFCRFYGFRKLRFSKGPQSQFCLAGFSDPTADPDQDEINVWLPSKKITPPVFDSDMARFLISHVGDQFCELVQQEMEVFELNVSVVKKPPAWKRLVQGIREMCDVCDTTLFNFHFACSKCGFGVCLGCYKARKNGIKRIENPDSMIDNTSKSVYDEFKWFRCSLKQPHEIEKLMLTQAIVGDALEQMVDFMHRVRAEQKILQRCGCPYLDKYTDIIKTLGSIAEYKLQPKLPPLPPPPPVLAPVPQPQRELAGSSRRRRRRADDSSDEESAVDESTHQFLAGILNEPRRKKNRPDPPAGNDSGNGNSLENKNGTIPVLSPTGNGKEMEETKPKISSANGNKVEKELKHFVRLPTTYLSSHKHRYGKQPEVIINSVGLTRALYPTVPHDWLCEGKLLRLLEPSNPGNYDLFQEVWKRGQPVIVSNVSNRLNPSLWSPESFSQDFGQLKNDLINCMTGKLVVNQYMKTFWDGFEYMDKRLKDEKGNVMLLKLKDWPSGDDFAEMLPSRFKDLMAALPLTEYTHRNGRLNLAARLPDNFVKPDLGPKMYIAYGSGLHLDKGTTNLHLDISDAVNLMVYAKPPLDSDNTEHNKAVLDAVMKSDCDGKTMSRVTEGGELPGALWHIYNARDADKIRDLVNLMAVERGERLERYSDPIHDQSVYLDTEMRKRLMDEYNVVGYPIVQCPGDAVFIPAGAPHQVRNLQNCIKIAEDFVSPENVTHCFHLTEEFRNLSETHTNREDKLQIKNIIYHTIKDCLSVLGNDLPEIPQIKGQVKKDPIEPKKKEVKNLESKEGEKMDTGEPIKSEKNEEADAALALEVDPTKKNEEEVKAKQVNDGQLDKSQIKSES